MENVEPFESILELMEMLIAKYGIMGIAAAMFAESAGVPFASAVVILTSGPLILRGTVSFWSIFLASTVGITLGSIFSYFLGLLGSLVGKKVKSNYGRQNYYNEPIDESVELPNSRIIRLWERYGNFSIFMGQLWGFTRTFISFPAGAMRMNFYLFIIYTFLGGSIYSLAAIGLSIALVGTMGATIKFLKSLADYSPLLLIVLVLIIIAVILCNIYKRKQNNNSGFICLFNRLWDRFRGRN